MAQVVALILVAQTGGGPAGVTSLEVGRFLSMEACRTAAAATVAVHPQPDLKVSYLCVPLTGSAR